MHMAVAMLVSMGMIVSVSMGGIRRRDDELAVQHALRAK